VRQSCFKKRGDVRVVLKGQSGAFSADPDGVTGRDVKECPAVRGGQGQSQDRPVPGSLFEAFHAALLGLGDIDLQAPGADIDGSRRDGRERAFHGCDTVSVGHGVSRRGSAFGAAAHDPVKEFEPAARAAHEPEHGQDQAKACRYGGELDPQRHPRLTLGVRFAADVAGRVLLLHDLAGDGLVFLQGDAGGMVGHGGLGRQQKAGEQDRVQHFHDGALKAWWSGPAPVDRLARRVPVTCAP